MMCFYQNKMANNCSYTILTFFFVWILSFSQTALVHILLCSDWLSASVYSEALPTDATKNKSCLGGTKVSVYLCKV